MADYSDSSLGKTTEYKDQYDPGLLFTVARSNARDQLLFSVEGLSSTALPFKGWDIWTGFELSWLNQDGMPQVAVGEFLFPCDSSHIVESKSFKLYLNSFNQTVFSTWEEVRERMVEDLSQAAGGRVDVILYQMGEYNGFRPVTEPQGICLDQQDIVIDRYNRNPDFLKSGSSVVEEMLYSHLLRTNCPVTGQPDWASIYISYHGPQIDRKGLLKYLVSYRKHQDFHEQCVETIFTDIMKYCAPLELDVYARYTRRGGLDINPYRSTRYEMPPHFRQVRQ